ncbi:MAG: hypothetical protein M3Y24_12775 [Acidobacteriota bacterium]|nr:hypothetical protein [Acidobacteriota bacterium]
MTADQNINYQQNLTERRISLVVLGSNIWRIVENYVKEIAEKVHAATPSSFDFIEMPLPPSLLGPAGDNQPQ